MGLNSPFDNAVLPTVGTDGNWAATRGGFDEGGSAPAGSLASPMGDTNFVGTPGQKETANSQSGLPQTPTTISVDGAPAAGSTIPMPDMTTTPDPQL